MWCIDPCLGGTWTARGSPLPAPRSLAWHVKTTPTRFPRAGPCPRCPAVQVTTPSPCPSLSTIAFQLALPFFDPVHPAYTPSRPHHHPTVHCLAAIPGPKAPPTTHLASSGPTRRSVQAAEAHRPDLATRRSGESRSCAQPQNTIHPPSTTARPPTCAARPRPFPTPGPRRKGGPRRGNIGGAAHHDVPCPARLLLTRPRRGRRQQTRWSGTRCCRPLPSGPTSCP